MLWRGVLWLWVLWLWGCVVGWNGSARGKPGAGVGGARSWGACLCVCATESRPGLAGVACLVKRAAWCFRGRAGLLSVRCGGGRLLGARIPGALSRASRAASGRSPGPGAARCWLPPCVRRPQEPARRDRRRGISAARGQAARVTRGSGIEGKQRGRRRRTNDRRGDRRPGRPVICCSETSPRQHRTRNRVCGITYPRRPGRLPRRRDCDSRRIRRPAQPATHTRTNLAPPGGARDNQQPQTPPATTRPHTTTKKKPAHQRPPQQTARKARRPPQPAHTATPTTTRPPKPGSRPPKNEHTKHEPPHQTSSHNNKQPHEPPNNTPPTKHKTTNTTTPNTPQPTQSGSVNAFMRGRVRGGRRGFWVLGVWEWAFLGVCSSFGGTFGGLGAVFSRCRLVFPRRRGLLGWRAFGCCYWGRWPWVCGLRARPGAESRTSFAGLLPGCCRLNAGFGEFRHGFGELFGP